MKKYTRAPVNRQRRELYGPSFPEETFEQRADDIRRKLIIDYSVPPDLREQGYKKRDTWEEEAKDIIELTGGGPEITVLDAGMSGGYMIRKLLDTDVEGQRFNGSVVGIDIETPHIHRLKESFSAEYPGANIQLGKADAEKLDVIKIGKAVHRIPDNYFDATIENYIHHHTPNPESAIDSAIRVTKPGGYCLFAARATGHLDNVYFCAGIAADNLGLKKPHPYYDNYDFFMMKDYLNKLESQGRCRIVKEVAHAGYLWIDGNDEGWRDFSNAVTALLPDMNRGSDKKRTTEELRDFLNNLLYPGYIAGSIRYHEGYIMDFFAQKYFAVEVLK